MGPATTEYETAFREAIDRAPGVSSFQFDRPEGYSFVPGQHFALTLRTREGEQTKHFSHSDAPSDPRIELTTRLTGSAFKDALAALRPGDVVGLAGPQGRLTVPDGVSKAAFLVGGVGVTPARSIVRDAVARATGLEVMLFYGNQDQASIPFGEELAGYAAGHAGIVLVDVLASPLPGWTGETGFITADTVRLHADPLDGWHWFVSGPPPMVEAMRGVLAELAVPADRTHLESFAGYG